MVSFTARRALSQPTSPIQAPPAAMPARAITNSTMGAGRLAMGRAMTAAASPPRTTAPSPPITTSPSWAGSATQSAVSSRGAARWSVFPSEKELAKAPRQTMAKKSAGDLPRRSRKSEKAAAARSSAASGISTASSVRRTG